MVTVKLKEDRKDDVVLEEDDEDEYNPYLNARNFEIHRTSNAVEVVTAIDALCDEFGEHTPGFKLHLKVLVCDLYQNYKGCKNRYLSVGLAKREGDFKLIKRYNKFQIGYRNLKKSIDCLKGKEYIEYKRGYLKGGFTNGFRTRIRATEKLVVFLENHHHVNEKMIYLYPDQELIVRKKKTVKKKITTKNRKGKTIKPKVKIKHLDAYRDTNHTNRWRNTLDSYNKLISRTYIDIDLTDYTPTNPRKKPLYLDLSRKTTRRIFSSGNFISGGRFYGCFHQGTPSDMRPYLLINGEHVVEHDFSGMHINILYSLIGKRLSDLGLLAYKFAKDNDPQKKRPYFKKLLLAAINAENRRDCLSAIRKDIRKNPQDYPDGEYNISALLDEILEYHPEINCFLNTGKGLYSQFVDSCIAYRVIKEMTNLGIPVLCIHDSFISAERYADQLLDCMKRSYVTEINYILKKNNHSLRLTFEDSITDETTIVQRKYPKTANLIKTIRSMSISHILNLEKAKEQEKEKLIPHYKAMNRGSLFHPFRLDVTLNKDQRRRQLMWLSSKKEISTFNETVEVRVSILKNGSYKLLVKNHPNS